jgi:tetratricopeptide (TPR) repeat protein
VLALSISVSVLAYRDWLSDVYLDQGIEELQMGREYTAREEFYRSLKLSFHPREVLFYLGVVNQQLGDSEKAEYYFKKSLNTFVVESTLLQLASINFQKQDYSEALKFLNQLLSIDPEDSREIQARFLIALIDLKQGKIKEAISKLDELIDKHSDFERAYMARAEIYKGQGKISQAKDDLKEALNLIEKKLRKSESKLRAGSKLTREEFAQIRSDIESLEKEKKSVEESLKELGFD